MFKIEVTTYFGTEGVSFIIRTILICPKLLFERREGNITIRFLEVIYCRERKWGDTWWLFQQNQRHLSFKHVNELLKCCTFVKKSVPPCLLRFRIVLVQYPPPKIAKHTRDIYLPRLIRVKGVSDRNPIRV